MDTGESRAEPQDIASPSRRFPLFLRAYLAHEALRYGLSAGVVLGVMLLVPGLLNNMVLTAGVLLLGVAIVPEVLRKRL